MRYGRHVGARGTDGLLCTARVGARTCRARVHAWESGAARDRKSTKAREHESTRERERGVVFPTGFLTAARGGGRSKVANQSGEGSERGKEGNTGRTRLWTRLRMTERGFGKEQSNEERDNR